MPLARALDMEELHDTRHWGKKPHGSAVFARSAYEDFFGGPPRHTAPFPVRFEDYCEILGTAASASSIPALDLPLEDEGCEFEVSSDGDRRGGVDYSEIFGGLGGGGFTVSYEELFEGPKRSGVSSLDGRARWGVLSEQQANEVSEHVLEGYSEDHLANLEMDQVPSVPKHSDDKSSQKFSMSYHKTSCGIVDDAISEKTHTAKLDAIPGFTIVVDASDPVLEMKIHEVNKGITNNMGTETYVHDGGHVIEAQSNLSSCADNYENLKADQTPSEPNCASLLDAPENQKHHSRSSSYHSASSGDISLSDIEYLKVSEISLQTKPLQGPPPSRPPPQLIKMPEHPKMLHSDPRSDIEERSLLKPKVKYQMQSSSVASKIHAIYESTKDSSFCNDNEMDPSSAAAASVAAIKVAMEHAQARLKSAKELMDRKRDKYKRNVGQPKAMTCEEDGASYEVALKSCSKVIAANDLLKENNLINEFTFPEREEMKNAGITTLNHEEKKGQFPSSGKDQQQVRQGNGFMSTEVTCEFDEISGEWKTEKKNCELKRNSSLLNKVKDIYMQENENKAKAVMYGCQGIEKDSKKSEQAFEVEENQQSSEASCSVEMLDNDNSLKGASMCCMNDAKKNLVEDFLLANSASKLKEACCFHLLDDTKKADDLQEGNTTDDMVNSTNSVVGSCLCKDSEKIVQVSNSSFKLGVDNDFFKEIEFKATKGIFGNVGNKREFNVSYLNFELNEIHKEFIVANEAVFQGRSVNESRGPDGLCANNTTDKMELAETKKINEYEKVTESMKHQYAYDVNRGKFEENNNAADEDEDEDDGLQANNEACILTKNGPEQEAIHDANGLENGKGRGEARTKLQEDESLGAHKNQELQNFEFFAAAERDCAEKGGERTLEVPVACNLGKNQISSISAAEVCQQDENESDAPEVILSGKDGNSPAKAPDTTKGSHAEVAENHNHSIHTEEEENKKVDMEKERDKEWAIRVEEKEREREREKDRIAMERANYEARHRALTEARERAERIAVERVTSEARQRALAEAREKAEKAAEAEKASREARLRAERSAVERATEEARQRAIEKALAEKATTEARSRMRKGNATVHFKAAHVKEDSETRLKSSSEILRNMQSQNAASTNGQRYSDSCDNGGSESKLRCEARQERQQRTTEHAAKALAERNLRDILAQREQAERDRLAESLDAEVRRWSSGKDGNLRALLSTLQYILGPDSGWQPISLTDVLTAAAVKKAYRKATLCVHPDKLQQRGATIQQKHICEKVFDLLKDAWNKFNSEER